LTAAQVGLAVASESVLSQGLLAKGKAMEGFAARFADLVDPRTGNAGQHSMLEMLVIASCVVRGHDHRRAFASSHCVVTAP
jgi:hypothetical protein